MLLISFKKSNLLIGEFKNLAFLSSQSHATLSKTGFTVCYQKHNLHFKKLGTKPQEKAPKYSHPARSVQGVCKRKIILSGISGLPYL